jgi:hypothetical protein
MERETEKDSIGRKWAEAEKREAAHLASKQSRASSLGGEDRAARVRFQPTGVARRVPATSRLSGGSLEPSPSNTARPRLNRHPPRPPSLLRFAEASVPPLSAETPPAAPDSDRAGRRHGAGSRVEGPGAPQREEEEKRGRARPG